MILNLKVHAGVNNKQTNSSHTYERNFTAHRPICISVCVNQKKKKRKNICGINTCNMKATPTRSIGYYVHNPKNKSTHCPFIPHIGRLLLHWACFILFIRVFFQIYTYILLLAWTEAEPMLDRFVRDGTDNREFFSSSFTADPFKN